MMHEAFSNGRRKSEQGRDKDGSSPTHEDFCEGIT